MNSAVNPARNEWEKSEGTNRTGITIKAVTDEKIRRGLII